MAGDYLKLVEQRLGVKFERVRKPELAGGLRPVEAPGDRHDHVCGCDSRTQANLGLYQTLHEDSHCDCYRPDVTYIADMRELAGKKVAVVDGYAVNDWIPRDFPEIRLVRFKTTQDCLKALQREKFLPILITYWSSVITWPG